MILYKTAGYFFITFLGFDTFRYHGRIAYEQQSTRWDFIKKAYRENGSGFHINSIGTYLLQVFFKCFIMLPNPPVSSVYSARPIIKLVIADSSRNRFLQSKRRQCRDFRRKIVIGCTFSTDG